jgi:hypothetical protein
MQGWSAWRAAVAAFRVAPRYGFFGHALGVASIFGRAAAIASAFAALFAGGIGH